MTTIPRPDVVEYLERVPYVQGVLSQHLNLTHEATQRLNTKRLKAPRTPREMTASERVETQTHEMREANRRAQAKKRKRRPRAGDR